MRHLSRLLALLILIVILSLNYSCSLFTSFDPDDEFPKFVKVNYIELDKIARISKFRSGAGHDYSDDFESCCSMKHYYAPYDSLVWNDIKIYSPVSVKLPSSGGMGRNAGSDQI